MWAKLDDRLLTHRKLMTAAAALGKNGVQRALGAFSGGALLAAAGLTNGFIPDAFMTHPVFGDNPKETAKAMVDAGFWERVDGGYQVHDWLDWNPDAESVLERQRKDRDRKRKPNGKA